MCSIPDRNYGISRALRFISRGSALLFLAAQICSGQVLQNGSFENDYTNWTQSGNQNLVTNDPSHPASDGTKVVVFSLGNQFANAVLSQSFSTTPGQRYGLAIDSGTAGAIADQRLEVRLTGNGVLFDQILTIAGLDAAPYYVPQHISFVANSATTTLTFQDASITYYVVDLLLDNVQIAPENAQAPLITSQPQRTAAATGRIASFSVVASGQSPTYQWRFNGNPISGANGSSYTIPAVANADAGNYDVVVSNGSGSVTSSAATLTVLPPGILLNGSFEYGSAAWAFAGAVSISTNTGYGVTDGSELVHFNFAQQPPNGTMSQSFDTSSGVTYVVAFDYGAFSFWNQNQQRLRVTVQGNSGSFLDQTVSVSAPGNGTRYLPATFSFVGDGSTVTLTFQDVSTNTDSIDLLLDNVRVTVQDAPIITSQPQSVAVETGGNATFSVTAEGLAPLHYQWRFNQADIPGANSNSYSINNAQSADGGNYDVFVTNTAGNATSATAVLTVLPPDLLTNGSFEFDYTGWTHSGNQVITSQAGQMTDGAKAVVFNAGQSTPNGVLSQTISTTPGQRYVLAFDLGANAYQSNAEQRLQVTVQGNSTLVSQTASIFAQGTGTWYATKSFSFIANSSSTTVTFQDVSAVTTNIDLLIDNVRISEASATILTNGGFENDYTGWNATGHQQVTSSPSNQVSEGAKAVLFNAGQTAPDGVLTQSFATTPGQPYALTFDMGATGFQTNGEERFQVTVQGGAQLVSQTASVFGQGTGTWFATKSFSFVADSSTTTLTFQDVSPATINIDALLDNVQVTMTTPTGPIITSQPQSATVQAGSPVSFSVTANGQGTLHYQWRFGGSPIPTAPDASIFNINSVQNSDSGNYDVIVTDDVGPVTSATAVLTVAPAGTLLNGSFESNYSGWNASGNQGIVSAPSNQVTDGSNAVAFNGGQKTPNGVLTQTFGTTPGQGYLLTFDLGTNAFQSTAQQQLHVTVQGNSPTPLLSQTASIVAQGTGTWYAPQSFTFVADSSTTTLTFQDVSSATINIDALLDNVRITAQSGPIITSQPQDVTVQAGNPATFSVTATGQGTLSYQWRFGGQDIGGANTDTYTINSVQDTDAGDYDVVVTDSTGPTTSAAATLTVVPAGILVNGSFEYGLFGWNATGAVDFSNFSGYAPTNGTNVLAFNSGQHTPDGVISQTFSTVPNQVYTLKFDLGVLSWQTTNEQKLEVDVVGNATFVSQVMSIFGPGTGTSYIPKTFTFTADSNQTTLTFRDRSVFTTNIDVMVDNVRVTAGP